MNDDNGEVGLAYLDEAGALLEAAGEQRMAALAHANASVALVRLGRHEEATARLEVARAGFHEVGATVAESQTLANLAGHYERAGDLRRARVCLTEALELQEASGAAEASAYTLAMLGYVSEREGELEEAARWTSLALEASQPLRKHEYLGYGLLFAADLVHRADEGEAPPGCSAPPTRRSAGPRSCRRRRRPSDGNGSESSSGASSARSASMCSRPRARSSRSTRRSSSASLPSRPRSVSPRTARRRTRAPVEAPASPATWVDQHPEVLRRQLARKRSSASGPESAESCG